MQTTERTPSSRIRCEVGESNSSMAARSSTSGWRLRNAFPVIEPSSGTIISSRISPFPCGKIERQHAHLIRRRFVQREARVFVMNHAAQGRGNGVQEGVQIELGNHGVVHFEQHAQPVALPRQLPLVGLRALEIQRVVHRDGDLPRHLLQERDFALGVLMRRAPPEAHHAQPALRRGQRQRANRSHSVLPQFCSSAGKRVSFSMSSRINGCCVSQTQPDGVSPTWNSVPRRVFRGFSDSRMCRRMTLRAGSCRIRFKYSNSPRDAAARPVHGTARRGRGAGRSLRPPRAAPGAAPPEKRRPVARLGTSLIVRRITPWFAGAQLRAEVLSGIRFGRCGFLLTRTKTAQSEACATEKRHHFGKLAGLRTTAISC